MDRSMNVESLELTGDYPAGDSESNTVVTWPAIEQESFEGVRCDALSKLPLRKRLRSSSKEIAEMLDAVDALKQLRSQIPQSNTNAGGEFLMHSNMPGRLEGHPVAPLLASAMEQARSHGLTMPTSISAEQSNLPIPTQEQPRARLLAQGSARARPLMALPDSHGPQASRLGQLSMAMLRQLELEVREELRRREVCERGVLARIVMALKRRPQPLQ
eukprot:jgi/Mesvir1/28091/Mv26202-RA.1